jgi:mannose-1-phosphate guanylyltransferase/mannose-6-phosphate isomerase
MSLIEKTILRAAFCKEIWICANKPVKDFLRKKTLLPALNILVEPDSKNTAPAVAWMLRKCMKKGLLKKEDILLITPCDHIFSDESKLVTLLKKWKGCAENTKTIVAFGITPDGPEIGYGYLRNTTLIEKPSLKLAKKLCKEANVLWNTGLYLVKVEVLIQIFKKYAPDFYQFLTADESLFHILPPLSLEKAILEQCSEITAVQLPLKWRDLGTWESIYAAATKDAHANAISENVLIKDSKNCLIMSKKKQIAAIGIRDLFIVETEDALLICKKGESHKLAILSEHLTL